MLSYGTGTVDDQVVQLAPFHLLQELLDQAIFAGASPDYGVVGVVYQEADGHHCKVLVVDG